MTTLTGTPVTGYVSLTNAAPGPLPFVLTLVRGQTPHTLQPNERLYLTNISASTNDSAGALITVDDGAIQTGIAVVTKLASFYLPLNQVPVFISFFAGCTRGGAFGIVPRATAAAVTAGKTVELTLQGYISRQ